MTDYRHLMDLPAGARTAQPFIEKRVDEIVGHFASSEEVQRFAQLVPPFLRHWLEIGVTALGGFLTVHRKKLPKGIGGDLMWIALNRAIDQAATQFGENLSGGAGEESAQKGEKTMEKILAFDRGKDQNKLHLTTPMCVELRPEREASAGKGGKTYPAVKHDKYTVEEAKTVGLIGADGQVAAKYACDNCKDAIAKLGATAAPKESKAATQPQFAPAPTTIGAAIAARLMPRDKPPKAAELLAADEDLAEKLDGLIARLRVEERAEAYELISRHLDSRHELVVLTSTDDENVFRQRLTLIRNDGFSKKLGVPELEKGAREVSDELKKFEGVFDQLGDLFGMKK